MQFFSVFIFMCAATILFVVSGTSSEQEFLIQLWLMAIGVALGSLIVWIIRKASK